MIAISANNLSKTFGITTILEGINFSISQGDKIGLIGKNGAGKTTLFKLLRGDYVSDTGNVFIAKTATVGYLEQIPATAENMTLYEYCLEIYQDLIEQESELREMEHQIAAFGLNAQDPPESLLNQYASSLDDFAHKNGYGFRSEVRGVLKGLGFEEYEFSRPIQELSGGQKSRLGIGRLLLKKMDILLLDEPTNHLDIAACAWLEGYLKSFSGTLIIISHDRYFLDQIVTRIFEVENCRLTPYTGNYSDYVIQKSIQYETAMKTFENQQKDIQKQEEIIKRFKGHGTEKLAKRAKSREKRLEHIELAERPVLQTKRAKIRLSTRTKSGEDVLFVENLSKSFGEKKLFEQVDLSAFRGDRIGLIGPNGIGKTTLFHILMGQEPSDSGKIRLGHHVEIGMYDQEQSNLKLENNLVEEISDASPALDTTVIRNLLGGFLFHGDDVFKLIKQLSGGERGRVSLLKLMLSESNLLLLDEPTNHLDIDSKEALEEALEHYDGTIIAISHDRYFLNKICNKTIHLSADGTTTYLGNYDYYKEKTTVNESLEQDNAEQSTKTKTQAKEDRRKDKEKLQAIRTLKQNTQALETRIAQVETELSDIDTMMCEEQVYSNSTLMKELSEKTVQLKTELASLYNEWESLMSSE